MLKKRILKDTDFLYISTRLNASEKDAVTGDKLTRLIDASDFDEAYGYVCEMYGVQPEVYGADYGKLLSEQLTNAYAFAAELIESIIDFDEKPYYLLDMFRYVYDCQNLKAAIKCEALGKEPASLLCDNGTVGIEKVAYCVNSRDFSAFPRNMAEAASLAAEQLAATGDPQEVDLILDRAAFRDMEESAKGSGLEYLERLIKAKTDSVNIISALRCIKQKKSRQYMQKLYVSGGTLDEDFFASNYDESIAKLISALAFTEYSAVAKYAEQQQNDISATDAEKLCSEVYLKKAYSAASQPFGAELLVCYIIRKEYEIRNIRVILAGKACGLGAEKIKERLMMDA